ncbi:DUF2478 domain-containing protein [Starkeya sp. 3C]|uniref:DUF2478 domain-containing protein n=1 Tax=Ancylobacter moscoviensis TaxID=2597768 RepID=A0ABY3DVE0_9HYPH|nr:DUF2478 domain-containing protein [Ancylobacter moscoviensis]TSJ64427.1 DUF2478 domain-containing protein [Ancylobacter moscoviensis]
MSLILALQGGPRAVIQAALATFAARRHVDGCRIAGLVEVTDATDGPGCAGHALQDLRSGRRYPIAQDLGRHSDSCHLDGDGVATACQAVTNALADGCDVLVLAKFGKLESTRSGLVDAFGRAIERGIPILTAVAPIYTAGWVRFAGDLATFARPDAAEIEDWWQTVRPDLTSPPSEGLLAGTLHGPRPPRPVNATRDHGLAVDPH